MRIAKFVAVMWRPSGVRVQGLEFRFSGSDIRV